MTELVLIGLILCLVFAYIPLTLVFIHSRGERWINDKYHHIKSKYWKTDYYGESESDIAQLEKDIEKELRNG